MKIRVITLPLGEDGTFDDQPLQVLLHERQALAVSAATGPEHRTRPPSRARAHTPFLAGRAEDQAPERAFGGRFRMA